MTTSLEERRVRRNQYTSPTLMDLTALVAMVRGETIFWSDGHVYRRAKAGHGIELSCIFPRWMVLAEWRIRDCALRTRARAIVSIRKLQD